MNSLFDRSKKDPESGVFENSPTSYSLSEIISAIPKVNFRKLKLNKFQSLYDSFKFEDITKISFDDSIFEQGETVKKISLEEQVATRQANPLRKKLEQDEYNVKPFDQEESDTKKSRKEQAGEKSQSKDITFNFETQIIKENENVIVTPETVSPEVSRQKDTLSISGEQGAFVWPPLGKSKKKKNTKMSQKAEKTGFDKTIREKKKSKKKPYFIKDEGKIAEESGKLKSSGKSTFPWSFTEQKYEGLENIFQGGLESELLDDTSKFDVSGKKLEERIQEIPEVQKTSFSGVKPEAVTFEQKEPILFRAFAPNLSYSAYGETVDLGKSNVFEASNKPGFGVEFSRKAGNMFGKTGGSKLTPVRIVVYGGLLATLGYLIWDSEFLNIKQYIFKSNTHEKVVVREVFKRTARNKTVLLKEKESSGETDKENLNIAFKPITEEERKALIEKAREALEGRLDPFGQEAVLPPAKQIEIKEAFMEGPPPEISLQRKQVELIGVISAEDKNLALVNVYTADYTVVLNDDKATRESKLKAALSMAVPNRLELSLLDPLEDWFVKQISKSKSRSDDPTVELVKGDKKFKLRVGQKVLFPEEKSFDEISEEFVSKSTLNQTDPKEVSTPNVN